MNFFIMVSLFLSVALGVFRGIDLALLTDAETGLCIVGPVWLRYGALAVAVGAAVAAGRCCKPQAGALRGHCTPSGVVALAASLWRRAAAVSRSLTHCGGGVSPPASRHWRRRSAMVRPLCCASSGCTAAW